MTKIARARMEDLAALSEIEDASFPEAWSRGQLASCISGERMVCLVVLEDERVSGYALARKVLDEAEILKLAVIPRKRGRGLGRTLVRELLRVLAGVGTVKVFLECRETNAPALRLYGSEGFRSTGRRRGYYSSPKEDALLLEKDL